MNCGIYYIKNVHNDRYYIGKSRHIDVRWKQHVTDLRGNRHGNKALQKDWNIFSETSFELGILEIASLDCIDELEVEYIYRYKDKDLYNYNNLNHPWRKMSYFAAREILDKSSAVEYVVDCDGDTLPLRFCSNCQLHKLAYTFSTNRYCQECMDLIFEEIDRENEIMNTIFL